MRVCLLLILLFGFLPSAYAQAEGLNIVDDREVEYSDGETKLSGYIALPARGLLKQLPVVIIVHEWWGHGDYVRRRADMIAGELGYVAFALDMYGDGKQAAHPEDAQKFSSEVSNTAGLREKRFRAALDYIKQQRWVDPKKVAAIGYCFGGGTVLEMARLKLPLQAIASFHGSLGSKITADKITTPLFVAHGGADEFVSPQVVEAFKDEMRKAEAPLTFISYEGAKHSFTNPAADEYAKKFNIPVGYNKEADLASWSEMKKFLKSHLE